MRLARQAKNEWQIWEFADVEINKRIDQQPIICSTCYEKLKKLKTLVQRRGAHFLHRIPPKSATGDGHSLTEHGTLARSENVSCWD